ncbi:MAG: DUF3553 domain-containing protein [Planctomycetes bacterium]|nr:DUF3553 domain-containing protein [Planctomycetota bacterium]
MPKEIFEFGDRVRLQRRPEWGIGSVVKVEAAMLNGTRSQSVSVRFANQGIKVLNTAVAEIELVSHEHVEALADAKAHPMVQWHKISENDWLAPIAQRKIQEVMVSLPENVRDAFCSIKQRLKQTLDLFRFERTGGSLIEWAIAQSGLDDPLSRFTRQELELLFDRWMTYRQDHLLKMLQEASQDIAFSRDEIDSLVAAAPLSAQEAVRLVTTKR